MTSPRRGMLSTAATLAPAIAIGIGCSSTAALAQTSDIIGGDTTLLQPSIPEGFDRGRNVSVLEAARPDYDALGVRISSFKLYPKIETGLGATSNVFLTDTGRKSDGYVDINPTAALNSDWSRNQLNFTAGTELQRYFSNPDRNQTAWNAGATGRLDISEDLKINAALAGIRQFESPYSGNVDSTVAVLSSYVSKLASLRADYTAGRTRMQVAVDHSAFDFSRIQLTDGITQDQSTRNHDVTRVAGQFEYAFTPSISAYGQASFDRIGYQHELGGGVPNRGSKGYRLIGGVNFDLSGFVRGTIGVGYVKRDYNANIYKPVQGVSAEAKVEYFPSDLTTFTLNLRRFLEDSGVSSNVAYFEDSASIRVDHALLENLLLNLGGEFGHVHYLGLSANRNSYRATGGGEYRVSRRFGLRGTISYGKQSVANELAGQNFNEVRGVFGFYVQR